MAGGTLRVSLDALTWAMKQRAGSGTRKEVLLVLAEGTNASPWQSRFGRSWPANTVLRSLASLCDVTELDRKTVIAALHALEEAALICRVGTDGQTNQIPVFRLELQPQTGAEFGTDPNTATGSQTDTDPEIGTVPVWETNSTVFPAERYRFSHSPVPNAVHGTVRNQKEPEGTEEMPARAIPLTIPHGLDRPLRPPAPLKPASGLQAAPPLQPAAGGMQDGAGMQPSAGMQRSRKPAKTTMPDHFGVTQRVRDWATRKGYRELEAHLEHFVGQARAKGYVYADWDQALMNAIRDDWAKLRGANGSRHPALGTEDIFAGAR
jgi:hypothetical protein